MKKYIQGKAEKLSKFPCDVTFNKDLGAYMITIIDPEKMYPCYWQDPEAGMREIRKTKNKRLCMR